MMKSLLVIATWVCWAVIVLLPALARPSTIEEIRAPPSYPTMTFDVDKYDTYSTFLTSLRAKLASGSVACNIPVTRAPATVSVSERFVLVNLKMLNDQTNKDVVVTLAIDVTNAYVVAYQDTFEAQKRAYFFTGNFYAIAIANLFLEGTQNNITFSESYQGMEGTAQKSRTALNLGFSSLKYAILSVYDSKYDRKLQARFLLIAIQMVAEAARFRYIQNNVMESGEYSSFLPDAQVISLEKKWDKLSKGIQKSAKAQTDKCVNIDPPVDLENPDGSIWQVTEVYQVKDELKVLNYNEDDDGKTIRTEFLLLKS